MCLGGSLSSQSAFVELLYNIVIYVCISFDCCTHNNTLTIDSYVVVIVPQLKHVDNLGSCHVQSTITGGSLSASSAKMVPGPPTIC